jgi:hypothetical protein
VDVASVAAAMLGVQAGRMQLAVAATMLKMNLNGDAAAANLINAGQRNIQNLGNAAVGLGQNLDISV